VPEDLEDYVITGIETFRVEGAEFFFPLAQK